MSQILLTMKPGINFLLEVYNSVPKRLIITRKINQNTKNREMPSISHSIFQKGFRKYII